MLSAALKKSQEEPLKGINIHYFIKNCSFLSGSLPHINRRLLVAIGLDIESPNVLVSWETFLELYCIFEAGRVEQQLLIDFWIKFFDQKRIGLVAENDYITLLEELVRGNSLKESNDTTRMFARMFQKIMGDNGCLDENRGLVAENLEHAFREQLIDIHILCSALGRQKLDAQMMNVNVF